MSYGKVTGINTPPASYTVLQEWGTERLDGRIAQIELFLAATGDDSLDQQITDAQTAVDAAQVEVNNKNDDVQDAAAIPDLPVMVEALTEYYKAVGERDSKQVILNQLLIQKTVLEKELAYLQENKPGEDELTDSYSIWCADYCRTLAIDDRIALCEMNGERQAGQLIRAQIPPHAPVIDEVNEYRATNSKAAVWPDYRLYAAAQWMAEDLKKTNTPSHTASDDSNPADRAERFGYPVNRQLNSIAETLTFSVQVVTGPLAVAAFKSSSAHDAILKDDLVRHIGVGHTKDEETGVHYWVFKFGYLDFQLKEDDRGTPGHLKPAIENTIWGTVRATALLTGWQKYQPTYRSATITVLDHDAKTADVVLDDAHSILPQVIETDHKIDINQTEALAGVPVRYGICDTRAFRRNDKVIVEFQGQNWQYPVVVGFAEDPRPCGVRFTLYRQDGETIRPGSTEDFFVTLYAVGEDGNPEGIGGGSYDPGFNPDPQGNLHYDITRNMWVIEPNPFDPRRVCKKVWVHVSAKDSIQTVYPFRYKTADQFNWVDLIELGSEIDIVIPYWRTESTPAQFTSVDTGPTFGFNVGTAAERDITVYSSVSYVLRRKIGGYKNINGDVFPVVANEVYATKAGPFDHSTSPIFQGDCVNPLTQQTVLATTTYTLPFLGNLTLATDLGTYNSAPNVNGRQELATVEDYTRFGSTLAGRRHYLEGSLTGHSSTILLNCYPSGDYNAPFEYTRVWLDQSPSIGEANLMADSELDPHWENHDAEV